jgi:hypothetical protein
MRRRQPTPSSSSSSDSDGSDIESCFDIEDGHEETNTNTDTELTGDDTDINDVDGYNEADLAWIAGEDNAFPLKYYLNQENNSDESKDKDKDYKDNIIKLLNIIKD